MDNRLDTEFTHPKQGGEAAKRVQRIVGGLSTFIQPSNFQYLPGCQLVVAIALADCLAMLVPLPLGPPVASYGVLNVLGLGLTVQVVGVANTPRCITGVATLLLFSQRSDHPLENPDVRSVGLSLAPEPPVPILVQAPAPQPARISLQDLAPEPWQGIGKLLWGAGIDTSRHVGHPTTGKGS